MTDGPPKSAVELAMAKLAQQDEEAGVEAQALSDDQKEALAEARRDYEAKAAECQILHSSQMAQVADPEARGELEANLRRDLARFATDRDRKIQRILKQDE
jgi:hypothetical protein